MKNQTLISYLHERRRPFARCANATQWHDALCDAAPVLYLQILGDAAADPSHQRTALINLLRRPAAHTIAYADIVAQLAALPLTQAIQVLDIVPQQHINGSRAQAVGLCFLLGHAQFPMLAATHRQRVAHLLKHLLGERTWSAAGRALAQPSDEGERFLQHTLLRWTRHPEAREALTFLAGVALVPQNDMLARRVAARHDITKGEGLPRETLLGLRGIYHHDISVQQVRLLAAIAPGDARQDGPLTALYKQALFEQPTAQTQQTLAERRTAAIAALPPLALRLGLILDLSASSASSGERLYHPAALGMALTSILMGCIRGARLYQIGGTDLLAEDTFPHPAGGTDLASALLAALQDDPQAIIIVTDGYENARPGDTATISRGLRQIGSQIPLYQVVPVYTQAEDLTQRQLGENLTVIK